MKHVTGDFIPSLLGVLEGLVTWILCSRVFCGHRDDLSLSYTLFDLSLEVPKPRV